MPVMPAMSNPIINLQRSAYQLSLADKAFFHFTTLFALFNLFVPSTGLSPGAADEVLLVLDLSHCIYADEI